ncbi:unnamed protein product [Ascophyllum nodosum]
MALAEATIAMSKEERKALKKARKKEARKLKEKIERKVSTHPTTDGEETAVVAEAPSKDIGKKASKKASKKRKVEAVDEADEVDAAGGGSGTPASSAKKEKVKKSKNKPRPSEPSPPDAADTNGEHPTADPSNGSSNSISSKRPKKTEKDAIAKKKKNKTKRENASATENPANGPGAGKANAAPGGATKVHVEGMSVTPLKDFADVDMPPEVMRYVTLQKWKEPTPIQAYCWPVLNAGRDVVGIAETGSGKTLAFSLPAMARIVKRAKARRNEGPFMLVLAPTRELALQSAEVIAEAGKHCGVRSACIYGGVPKWEQKKALGGAGGCCVQVVVATPGRLKDLVGEGACDLSQVTSLVLDEADRMLDLGFEQDVRDIIGCCAKAGERQTAMFSATWPKSIRDLAAEFLTRPVKVNVGDDELTANSRVEQHVEVVEERERDGKLLRLLAKCHGSRNNRVLVFALYKREAARLEQFLQRNSFDAVAVHGDKGQGDRERALGQFKSKECPLMVATDVAARGLDIPDVEYVINYSFPLTIEDYIHRIGRTGRAGKKGVSHTFFHQGDKARAGELVNVLQDANQSVPEALMRFGTHVKKKEHKLYGAFAKDVDMDKKSKKTTFDDSDDE